MEWFDRSLFNKVLAINIAGAFTIALATLFFLFQTNGALSQYQALIDNQLGNQYLVQKVDSIFQAQGKAWKNLIIRGKKDNVRDKYWQTFQSQGKEFEQSLARIKLDQFPELANKIELLQSEYREMMANYKKAYDRYSTSKGNTKIGDAISKGKDRKVSQMIGELLTATSETANQAIFESKSSVARTVLTSTGILFIAIVLFAIVNVYVSSNSYVKPAVELAKVIDRQSKGNLSDEMFINRKDELGVLADASRRLRVFLQDVNDYLLNSGATLHESSSTMEKATTAAVSQVGQAQSQTDSITTATETLLSVAGQVSEKANSGAELASHADQAANGAVSSMGQAEMSIHRLTEQLDSSALIVKELQDHAENVGRVLAVIQDIAEQTNLLALNAAIEAARAGEQGRGFAVVADEVRALASQTQRSTEEIEEIISSVQSGSQKTVQTMQASQSITQDCTEQFTTASDNLKIIANNIGQLNTINLNISDHVKEQTQLSDTIIDRLHQVLELIHQTTKDIQETKGVALGVDKISTQAKNLSTRFKAGL